MDGDAANTTFYEYYDYVDPVTFDESELKANKYSIVIAVWIGLAAFSVFLFLILLYMSRTDSPGANFTARRNQSARHSRPSDITGEDPGSVDAQAKIKGLNGKKRPKMKCSKK